MTSISARLSQYTHSGSLIPGPTLVVGVVDGVQDAAAGVRVVAAGGGPGQAFQQQRPCDRSRVGGAGDGGFGDEQAVFAFADVGDLVGEAGQ